MADEEDVDDVAPSLLPTSSAARKELLRDEGGLRQLCEEYFSRHAGCRSAIGVRVAGRIIADLYRELCLPIPSEEALYRAMTLHSCGNAFRLEHTDFVALMERVLVHCIRGEALEEELPCAEQNTDPVQSEPPISVGLIHVHMHRVDGASSMIQISDLETTDALQDSVQVHLAVPQALQRLLLGTRALEPCRPLFEQGVSEGAAITVVRCKPQATLLRIRRVNLGDTSVPIKKAHQHIPQSQLEKTVATERAPRNHLATNIVPMHSELACRIDRQPVADVRIRRANLGRIC